MWKKVNKEDAECWEESPTTPSAAGEDMRLTRQLAETREQQPDSEMPDLGDERMPLCSWAIFLAASVPAHKLLTEKEFREMMADPSRRSEPEGPGSPDYSLT